MKFYKDEPTKRIVDNYEFLINNEYFINKAVKLYEQKKMDEFYIEYAKVSDLIPLFSMTLKDTENKIQLMRANKLNVDENELSIFAEYITEIKKNKIRKYLNIKKIGDDLLKKKGRPVNLPNNHFSNPGEIPKRDMVQNNQIHTGNNNSNEIQVYNEMNLKLNERKDKLNQIQDKSDNMQNSSEQLKKLAAQYAKKDNNDCSIF